MPHMCCGGGIRRGGAGDKDPVVDIERLLVDYAWRELADTSLWDRLVRHRRYEMDVNWSYFEISHRVVAFHPRSRRQDVVQDSIAGAAGEKPTVGRRELCLFRTEFVNSSTLPQNFTFKTERTTTSRCHISLQRGFRIGANVNVQIALPLVSISIYRLLYISLQAPSVILAFSAPYQMFLLTYLGCGYTFLPVCL